MVDTSGNSEFKLFQTTKPFGITDEKGNTSKF